MRATDVVRERALELAAAGREDEEAVSELIQAAAGRRVAVVMARQELEQMPESADSENSDQGRIAARPRAQRRNVARREFGVNEPAG